MARFGASGNSGDRDPADDGERGTDSAGLTSTRQLPRYDGDPPAPPRRGLWRNVFGLLAVVLVVLVALVGARAFHVIGWPSNPFAKKTTDNSQPVLLQSIKDLSRYEAASGNFQVVIDLRKEADFIPSALLGERTLFVAAGSVDAYVDFSKISDKAITTSADKGSVTVRLPEPGLEKPNIDHNRSYVFAEQRGLLDRFKSLVSDNPNRQRELYQLAEQKIGTAANDAKLTDRAEANTRAMLTGMLRSLGYSKVTVTFGEPTS